jgi:hypothetical protein
LHVVNALAIGSAERSASVQSSNAVWCPWLKEAERVGDRPDRAERETTNVQHQFA